MQPTPNVTPEDVIRVLQRDYPNDTNAVLQEIRKYGVEKWHREEHRVHLAILKLAEGDASQIAAHTQLACSDYRDVLSAAEYPHYTHERLPADSALAHDTLRRDSAQYREWLTRE